MRKVAWTAAFLLAGCQSHSPTPNTAGPTDAAAEVRAFTSLLNRYREGMGCGPLRWDGRVAAVARAHSEDMARNNYFSHTNRQGQSPLDRLRAARVPFRAAAENIARGQMTGQQVLERWLSSAEHSGNIENCNYNKHGVAIVSWNWTHVFIRDP
jgi:uncharacterized protein YkwD